MEGKCYLCGKQYDKRGITRHMQGCTELQKFSNGDNGITSDSFIMMVSGKYSPHYWMVLRIYKDTLLEELDGFLREVWLECCGHLSVFRILGVNYDCDAENDPYFDSEDMNFKIGSLVDPGDKFDYEYDFGSTTHLTLKVVAEKNFGNRSKNIELIARNTPPEYKCVKCAEKAVYVNAFEQEAYCSKCSEEYSEDEIEEIHEGMNSPRDGICGYVGTQKDETPYLMDTIEEKNDDEIQVKQLSEHIDLILKKKSNDIENHLIRNIKKIIKPIYDGIGIREHLSKFNKNVIVVYGKTYRIDVKMGMKKDDMLDKIEEEYPTVCSENLKNLDGTELELLKTFLNHKTMIPFENIKKMNCDALMDKGFLIYGQYEDYVAGGLSKEARELLEEINFGELKEFFNKNRELIDIIDGYMLMCGVIRLPDLVKKIYKVFDGKKNRNDIAELIQELCERDKYDKYVDYIVRKDVEYPETLIHEQSDRKNFDYADIEKETLLDKGIKEILNNSKYLRDHIIECYNIQDSEITEDVVILSRKFMIGENFNKILKEWLETFGFESKDEVNEMVYYTTDMYNQTRQWALKGNSPDMAMKLEETKKVNIGRNDPCPCGSGKKHKKCCGKI